MKPQFHPSADDITIESILHALSDPAGVQIFAAIAQSDSSGGRVYTKQKSPSRKREANDLPLDALL
jgi:hypothetical protein